MSNWKMEKDDMEFQYHKVYAIMLQIQIELV